MNGEWRSVSEDFDQLTLGPGEHVALRLEVTRARGQWWSWSVALIGEAAQTPLEGGVARRRQAARKAAARAAYEILRRMAADAFDCT